MALPRIVTVILNTNRREDTLACLASLHKSSYPNNTILVLDNASMDGSVPAICENFPDVKMIELNKNLGYAGNNNVGIQAAMEMGADWVFVLNEDTILDPCCIEKLIEAGEDNPEIGILGPMVYHYDEPSIIQSAGGMLTRYWHLIQLGKNEEDRNQYPETHNVQFISGCAIMVRRPVIQQIGGLDERFFYYWEEADWCLRALSNGWQVVHVPQAKLWHKGVQRNYHPSPNVTYYWTRNWFLMLSKNHAPLIAWAYAWFLTTKTLVSWTVKPKWHMMRYHRDAIWHGMVDFWRKEWGRCPHSLAPSS